MHEKLVEKGLVQIPTDSSSFYREKYMYRGFIITDCPDNGYMVWKQFGDSAPVKTDLKTLEATVEWIDKEIGYVVKAAATITTDKKDSLLNRVKKVEQWQTSNGGIFDTQQDAINAEVRLDILKMLSEFCRGAELCGKDPQTIDCEYQDIVTFIVNRKEQFLDLLAVYEQEVKK